MYSIETNTKTIYSMFYLIFNDFYMYMLVLNLTPATHFKEIGTGTTKDWASCRMLKKSVFGIFHWFTDNRWYHDWVFEGHPQKAQSLTIRDGQCSQFCETQLYKGYYYKGSGTFCEPSAICLQINVFCFDFVLHSVPTFFGMVVIQAHTHTNHL